MKRLVLDASSTLAGFLPDENSPIVREFFSDLDRWEVHVPAIWPLEISNALLNACRRGRLANDDAERVLESLAGLDPRVTAPVGPDVELFRLAYRHGLSIYDASYLELALRLGASLATLDTRLAAAAKSSAIDLPMASD